MALAGGGVSNDDLADALICEALGMSWDEVQATPEAVLRYRMALKQEKARLRAAAAPLGGMDGS